MKKILFHATSFTAFWAHYSFINDQTFNDKLKELGYQLIFSDKHEPEEADWILFNEATSVGTHRLGLTHKIKYYINLILKRTTPLENDVYAKCVKKGLLSKTALLVMEGPVGMPANHSPHIKKLFPKVLTWNDSMVDGKQVRKFNWPVPEEWPIISGNSFSKRKLFINISANKYSSHPLELYSDRRNIIHFLEKKYPADFDLYGIGWNEPATRTQVRNKQTVPFYKSYLGSIEDKAKAFPQYRFAVCYENSCVPGWITEKIFDCLRSSCVPIYLGAPNILDFVDADTFIDKRNFSSNEELFGFLANMEEAEYQKYLDAIDRYLAGPKFKSFLTTTFAERLVHILETEKD